MNKTINEYANSMFKHEIITDLWIKNCTEYIINIFSDSIKDKVILDYGFGRGNWSLAFLKAGAKKVVAIDASKDNVKRFQLYLNKNKIKNIEIIEGNFLENSNYNLNIDIFWIYGILQHIENDLEFLNILKKFAKNSSIFYIYAYPSNSIRYFLVNNSRKILLYKNYKQYLRNSGAFILEANMRIRDDLTAPYIKWYSRNSLKLLLEKAGLYIEKVDQDFYYFINHSYNKEFEPLQFQCSFHKNKEVIIEEETNDYLDEINILQKTFDSIHFFLNNKNNQLKKYFIIGFNNTYYSNIYSNNLAFIIEKLFIYLFHFIITQRINLKDEILIIYLDLLNKSIKNEERDKYEKILGNNIITKLLINNKVRI